VAGGQVDAIVDLVGGTGLQDSLAAVRAGGQLAAIATPRLDLDPVLDANLTFHGVLIQDNGIWPATRAVPSPCMVTAWIWSSKAPWPR
jgi:NADPH:quinone reductase-like Zn-dependent oxidoreductase